MLALLPSQAGAGFNRYTGEIISGMGGFMTGVMSGSIPYDLPVPVPSFGFKLSY